MNVPGRDISWLGMCQSVHFGAKNYRRLLASFRPPPFFVVAGLFVPAASEEKEE